MRRRYLLALLLSIPSAAWAYPWANPWLAAVASYFTGPADAPYQMPYAVPPKRIATGRNCPVEYLHVVAARHFKGTTEILFSVKRDGAVSGMVVAASSANTELDLLSAVCVSKWRYEPAKENGAPVEVTWEGQISWTQMGTRPKGETPQLRLPATNCIRNRPGAADRTMPKEPTTVRYELVNGEVTGSVVEHGSGDASLDDYAASCVKTWHFLPLLPKGMPATGTYTAVLFWEQP